MNKKFTWLWVIWILAFAGIEGAALFNDESGDTLSEHAWELQDLHPAFGVALAGFFAWLVPHIMRREGLEMSPTKAELTDLFWRCVHTFIQSFLASMLALPILANLDMGGTVVIDLNALQLAASSSLIAGLAAVGSVIKTYSSNKLGSGTATPVVQPKLGMKKPVASSYVDVLKPPPTGEEVP